jgi:hypothetical protein
MSLHEKRLGRGWLVLVYALILIGAVALYVALFPIGY